MKVTRALRIRCAGRRVFRVNGRVVLRHTGDGHCTTHRPR